MDNGLHEGLLTFAAQYGYKFAWLKDRYALITVEQLSSPLHDSVGVSQKHVEEHEEKQERLDLVE